MSTVEAHKQKAAAFLARRAELEPINWRGGRVMFRDSHSSSTALWLAHERASERVQTLADRGQDFRAAMERSLRLREMWMEAT